jgi:hypothetical protein
MTSALRRSNSCDREMVAASSSGEERMRTVRGCLDSPESMTVSLLMTLPSERTTGQRSTVVNSLHSYIGPKAEIWRGHADSRHDDIAAELRDVVVGAESGSSCVRAARSVDPLPPDER